MFKVAGGESRPGVMQRAPLQKTRSVGLISLQSIRFERPNGQIMPRAPDPIQAAGLPGRAEAVPVCKGDRTHRRSRPRREGGET